MKNIKWISFFFLANSACNPVTNIQPTPTDGVPQSAIQAVIGQFSKAEEIVFKTLERNRVWQVSFRQKTTHFTAATNEQRLLVAYQLDTRTVPDSLTSQIAHTVIEGGTFSSLRIQDYSWYQNVANNGQFIYANYDWGGNRYTFRWNVTNIKGTITYVTELFPYYQLEYRTTTLADLPTLIQESLKSEKFDFNFATIQIGQDGKKRYAITVNQNNSVLQLQYNNDGLLTSVSDPQRMQSFTALSQLPISIQNYIRDTPELAGFGMGGQFAMLGKTTYNQLESYQVNLQKGRQTWFMVFNSRGELVTRTYLNLV